MTALVAWCAVLCVVGVRGVLADNCPIQSLAGQILDGETDQVSLIREGHQVPVQEHTCILFGDRLDASQVLEVRVSIGGWPFARVPVPTAIRHS